MGTLLKRLLGLLFPGVDDPDPAADADPAADPADPAADPAGGDDDDEIEYDLEEVAPPARARSTGNEDRLARLEAEFERRTRAVDEARARGAAPAAPAVDPEFQREEENLRRPDITEQERWQINANRVLRATQQQANAALFQAQDMSDRTQFESKVATDPRREKYRDRVEQAVQEERRQGRNVAREAVYYHMLGKDIAEGKLKPKARAKTPAADVPRGRTPNARSDVSARGARTEHQKRAARLENLNI
jgi:hypothetical protein